MKKNYDIFYLILLHIQRVSHILGAIFVDKNTTRFTTIRGEEVLDERPALAAEVGRVQGALAQNVLVGAHLVT